MITTEQRDESFHDYRVANLVYLEYCESESKDCFALWVYDKMVEADKAYAEKEPTLHWSPDTGRHYWNKGGELSQGFESVKEAKESFRDVKYQGNQIDRWLRLGMAIE